MVGYLSLSFFFSCCVPACLHAHACVCVCVRVILFLQLDEIILSIVKQHCCNANTIFHSDMETTLLKIENCSLEGDFSN